LAPLRTGNCLTVCLIGPECTGKTTLAERLAVHYGAPWVPEFAREYALRVGRLLTFDDVEPIARGQMASEDTWERGRPARLGQEPAGATPSLPGLVILDTDLISTVVYSLHYYGQCPEWIGREGRARIADLYLLTDIDIPWAADGVRDSAAARALLHGQFATMLGALGANFVTIRGDWERRFADAVAAITRRLDSPRDRPPAAVRNLPR